MADTFDRCQCSGLTFEQIKAHADDARTTSIKRLKRELEMGAYCSACVPYLKEMFKSGRTTFAADEELVP